MYYTYSTDACLHSDVVKSAATCMYVQIYKTGAYIKIQGCFSRHAAINAIIHRSLSCTKWPSTLEPIGLCISDGKRPDGCSIAPWKSGQCLFLTPSQPHTSLHDATRGVRAVATAAEARKGMKYALLSKSHHFVPIAIET